VAHADFSLMANLTVRSEQFPAAYDKNFARFELELSKKLGDCIEAAELNPLPRGFEDNGYHGGGPTARVRFGQALAR